MLDYGSIHWSRNLLLSVRRQTCTLFHASIYSSRFHKSKEDDRDCSELGSAVVNVSKLSETFSCEVSSTSSICFWSSDKEGVFIFHGSHIQPAKLRALGAPNRSFMSFSLRFYGDGGWIWNVCCRPFLEIYNMDNFCGRSRSAENKLLIFTQW